MIKRRYDLMVFGMLFLALVGYFGYGYAQSHARQTRALRSYRAVPAIVISSDVVERGSHATTHGTSYWPRIVTQYDVAGQVYQSDRYAFTSTGWSDRASVQQVVERYRVGSAIEVFVDPDNPRLAVIERTAPDSRGAWILAVLASLSLGLIAYGLGLGRRGNERRR